jgi:hypothetical protein
VPILMDDHYFIKAVVRLLHHHGYLDQRRITWLHGPSVVYADNLYFAGGCICVRVPARVHMGASAAALVV